MCHMHPYADVQTSPFGCLMLMISPTGGVSIELRSDLRHRRNKWFDVAEALSSGCCEVGAYLGDSTALAHKH